MACASANFNTGSTLASDTMPRVRPPPGRIITVSNVPSMFLTRLIVSRRVFSPIESSTVKEVMPACQGKIEMSPLWQSRNVPFCRGFCGVHVILRLPVKQRRALVATNPIKE
jgi:hypothetical protein